MSLFDEATTLASRISSLQYDHDGWMKTAKSRWDQIVALKEELKSIKCQASQLLLDKANLQRDLEQVNKQCDSYMKDAVFAEHERDELKKQLEQARKARDAWEFKFNSMESDLDTSIQELEAKLGHAKKWHCGGCWNEENLQKQLEDARNGWKLDHADLVSERELNDDLKKQLLDATKQSDSHYAKWMQSLQDCNSAYHEMDALKARAEKAEKELATSREAHINYIEASGDTLRKMRLDNEDLVVRAKQAENKTKFLAECLDEKAKFALKLDADLTAARKERDDWESQARALSSQVDFKLQQLQNYSETNDALRTRVSELTSLLASKENVIEGLKAEIEKTVSISKTHEERSRHYFKEADDLMKEYNALKAQKVEKCLTINCRDCGQVARFSVSCDGKSFYVEAE